jgi:hypothetical protein
MTTFKEVYNDISETELCAEWWKGKVALQHAGFVTVRLFFWPTSRERSRNQREWLLCSTGSDYICEMTCDILKYSSLRRSHLLRQAEERLNNLRKRKEAKDIDPETKQVQHISVLIRISKHLMFLCSQLWHTINWMQWHRELAKPQELGNTFTPILRVGALRTASLPLR